jgi:hypothetical protein
MKIGQFLVLTRLQLTDIDTQVTALKGARLESENTWTESLEQVHCGFMMFNWLVD